MGLKRQKAELSLTYYYTNPDQSLNEDRGPQKKTNLLLNRQKAIFPNYYDPCSSPSNTALYQNLYFSCHVFHVTVQLTKKEEENSNPGHFALAVTDKLQTRRGKVGGSF